MSRRVSETQIDDNGHADESQPLPSLKIHVRTRVEYGARSTNRELSTSVDYVAAPGATPEEAVALIGHVHDLANLSAAVRLRALERLGLEESGRIDHLADEITARYMQEIAHDSLSRLLGMAAPDGPEGND